MTKTKELKERQKAQLRQKALKKGLDPEALVGKYPPMIRMYSKYERRTDTRTYDDRKKLYEGGWEVISRDFGCRLEREVRGVDQEAQQETTKVVRREAWQEGWMLPLLRERRRVVRKQLPRRKKRKRKRRRRKRRRSKSN